MQNLERERVEIPGQFLTCVVILSCVMPYGQFVADINSNWRWVWISFCVEIYSDVNFETSYNAIKLNQTLSIRLFGYFKNRRKHTYNKRWWWCGWCREREREFKPTSDSSSELHIIFCVLCKDICFLPFDWSIYSHRSSHSLCTISI